jgi:hypothetical protein
MLRLLSQQLREQKRRESKARSGQAEMHAQQLKLEKVRDIMNQARTANASKNCD